MKYKLSLGGKNVAELDTTRIREVLNAGSYYKIVLGLVDISFYAVIIMLIGLNALISNYDYSSLSALQFYGLSIFSFIALLTIFALAGGKYFKDLPLMLTVVLYSIINMGGLMISTTQTMLVGSSLYMINSGLSIMSLVVVTYYAGMSFGFGSKWRNLYKAFVVSMFFGLVLGTLDIAANDEVSMILIGMIPIWTVGLIKVGDHWYKYPLSLLLLLNFAYLWKYMDAVEGYWALIIAGLVWLILGIFGLSDPIKQTKEAWTSITKRKSINIDDIINLYKDYPSILYISLGALYVLLGTANSISRGESVLADLIKILSRYQRSLSFVSGDITTLLFGIHKIIATSGTFLTSMIQLSGLVGVLSLLVLGAVGVWVYIRRISLESRTSGILIGYLMVSFILLGILVPLSNTIFIVWWFAWVMMVAYLQSQSSDSEDITKLPLIKLDRFLVRKGETIQLKVGSLSNFLRPIILILATLVLLILLSSIFQLFQNGSI